MIHSLFGIISSSIRSIILGYEELFDSNPVSWSSTSAEIRIANSKLQIRADRDRMNSETGYIDLANDSNLGENLSDTVWTVDLIHEIIAISQASTNWQNIIIRLAENNLNEIGGSTTDDAILLTHWARNSSSGRMINFYVDEGVETTIFNDVSGIFSSTGIKYFRQIRESATSLRVIVSPNTDWSNPDVDNTNVIPSTITGLQYFKTTLQLSSGTSNKLEVDIDTLRIYNGTDRGTTDFNTIT